MDEELLRGYYAKRGFDSEETDKAVQAVSKYERSNIEDIKRYVAILVEKKENTADELLALARYFYITGNNEAYIYFTSIFGGDGVMDNIRSRIAEFAGKEVSDEIFEDIEHPVLGAPPEEMTAMTACFMEKLKSRIGPERYKKMLAGNNHGIPEKSLAEEKKLYKEADSLDRYLKEKHKRSVDELQRYCDTKKIWYEQIITQEVVDYVRSDQEILSAVREGDKLYVTKIPYDPANYLREKDPLKKRYYACHCPFVRGSVLSGKKVDPDWCYCSAGFEKFLFDVIFDADLEVEVLESVLLGYDRCRYSIKIPKTEDRNKCPI